MSLNPGREILKLSVTLYINATLLLTSNLRLMLFISGVAAVQDQGLKSYTVVNFQLSLLYSSSRFESSGAV